MEVGSPAALSGQVMGGRGLLSMVLKYLTEDSKVWKSVRNIAEASMIFQPDRYLPPCPR